MIHFDWPLLLLLLPLPWLIRRYTPTYKGQQDMALKVPFFTVIKQMTQAKTARKSKIHMAALSVIWLCVLFASMHPKWVGEPIELPISGRDLMLAIDLSGSMGERDLHLNDDPVNRLTVVKHVISKFIERREGDRIGLILFGSQAYLQTPLTFDRAVVQTMLDESELGLAGEKTAIGDGIGLAVKRLASNPESQRTLILITDGANTAGTVEPLKAAELAAQEKVKIYTIGVGADEAYVRGFFGGVRKVNPSADLDEKTLKAIASKTGGQYFRARSTDELENIYARLDELEPVEADKQTYRPQKALFMWPLGFALALACLLIIAQIIKVTIKTRQVAEL